MRTTVSSAVALALASCGPASPTVPAEASNEAVDAPAVAAPEQARRIDIHRLLGADKAAVASVLGEPTGCRREASGELCAYGQEGTAGAATELFFIGGRVANLTLPGFGLPHEPSSLRVYGIEVGAPVFTSPAVTRWDAILGEQPVEVSMFPDGAGRIDYVFVKSLRP